MRRLVPLAALAAAGCFGGLTPEGKYYCANQNGCISGYVCYQNYCCVQDRTTGLCVDHPCIVNGTDLDHDNYPLCAGDCDDNDPTVNPGAAEICDHKDNNCNGQVDEGVLLTMYRDRDGDGHGDKAAPVQVCPTDPLDGLVTSDDDCNDSDPAIYAGAVEVCDGKDNNCNNEVDEGVMLTWYLDADKDGYGRSDVPMQACAQPIGYVAIKDDCDDSSAQIHPGAIEVCNDVDDDCDGLTDEDVKVDLWTDADDDGYGNPDAGLDAGCTAGPHQATNKLDCNDDPDGGGTKHPGAVEICDGEDNNCDRQIDENVQLAFWTDKDGDEFGDRAAAPRFACAPDAGEVGNNGDCNDDPDGGAAIHPGAVELCDGVDNNCNGINDEGLTVTYFEDKDGDGYGDPLSPKVVCPGPLARYVDNPLDCDDSVAGGASVYPGAPELCDGKDNNCDGVKDNNPLCGPRSDQTETAALWGAGFVASEGPPADCLAPGGAVTAIAPVADTSKLGDGGTSISVSDTSTHDFFAYYPQARNAGWTLSGQKLAFELAAGGTGWSTAFRQPAVLFCNRPGVYAKWVPAASVLSSSFAPVTATVGGGPGTWSPVGGFNFNGSPVNWIEIHFDNGAGAAQVWLDDFRIEPQ